MTTINDGGPAFPIADPFAVKGPGTESAALRLRNGMTLRDYFAAKAMQAMLSSPNCPKQVEESELSRQAFMVADAMLKARESK